MAPSSKFYAIVAGVGAGTGRSVALKFAKKYPVILIARQQSSYKAIVDEIKASGGSAHGVTADVGDSASLRTAFESIKQEAGSKKLAAAIFNVGGRFVRKPFLELSEDDFTAGYSANGLGLFNFAQLVLPLLLDSVGSVEGGVSPTLLLTGATASLKGSASCASFASGKFAMRAVGQSLAREFGPKGVHVAHIIVDGVIDIPRTSDYQVNGGVEGGKLSSDAIADTYWHLHEQHRSAWSQEIDLRPFVEKW